MAKNFVEKNITKDEFEKNLKKMISMKDLQRT